MQSKMKQMSEHIIENSNEAAKTQTDMVNRAVQEHISALQISE